MSNNETGTCSEFDEFASNYDDALNRGLKFTGEAKEYFAEQRVRWFRRTLGSAWASGKACLDYGCGTGTAAGPLREIIEPADLVGVDLSEESISVARVEQAAPSTSFYTLDALSGISERFDLAYCNGVFHHIPPEQRAGCASAIFQAMKPGGWFAFWENNPWNPIVRFMMSRVPFDKDAIMLWPGESRRLLQTAGFEVQRTDFLFIFPNALKGLRKFEPSFSKLPLGGQYQVLVRKPMGS